MYNKFIKKYNKWKINVAFITQKLIDLVNNQDSRLMLIKYIKSHDLNNPVIQLLMSADYKLHHHDHEDVSILKQDSSNPYYWVTKWKDEMNIKIRKEKPTFNIDFYQKNTPINIILNSSEMIPYWMNYNDNMNLFLIQIKINGLNNDIYCLKKNKDFFCDKSNNYFQYLDSYTNKWNCYKRLLLANGDPSCCPIKSHII